MDAISTRLFGLFLLSMGLWVIYLGRKATKKASLAVDWPMTQGRIIESEVRKKPGANAKYRFRLKYEYEVDRKQYKKKIAIGGEISCGRSRAEKRQAQYPMDSVHSVYFNPNDAKEAYLEPNVQGGGKIELFG